MRIVIKGAGKRYNFEWILRDINITLSSPNAYAILGPNGSGKSTLIQLIAGNITPSEGSVEFQNAKGTLDEEEVFKAFSISAPYLELIEEFTAVEMIMFHSRFKPFRQGMGVQEVLEISRLQDDRNKEVRNFSSGMKQRLKLSLALLSDVQVILLDEPTTNLDRHGVDWYLDLMSRFAGDKLIVVASNQEREYAFCGQHIDVAAFKSS